MEVKEAPVRGLRAVFAGFGRALGGRRKGGATAKAKAASDSGHVKVLSAEDSAAAETVTAQTATPAAQPQATVAEVAAPEAVAAATAPTEAEPVAAETATPAQASDVLPLANYDTLTVASLRARLRTLTVPQLRILIDYENAHQGRGEVTGMFERRIAKIVAGETTGFPAVS